MTGNELRMIENALRMMVGTCETEEIGQYVIACFGEDGFRVYLGAFDQIFLVSDAHYLSLFGVGGDFEAGGETFRLDNQ